MLPSKGSRTVNMEKGQEEKLDVMSRSEESKKKDKVSVSESNGG